MIESVFHVDGAQLVALWQDVFGDPPALAEDFLRRLPAFGCGFAAQEGEKVLGAAYWIDGLEIAGEKTGYLYAVAVRPEARGRGLGAALSRACFEAGRARGAVYRCTAPAEPSLFGWYERILGVKAALYRHSVELAARPGLPVTPIRPEDYAARRDALLGARPHLRCHREAMAYEAVNCRTFGGDFYAVGEGIAAASVEDGVARVREALGEEPERIASALAVALGCERALLLRCADEGTPFLAADRPFPPGTVWNLAFD